jgi:dGTPase
MLRPGVETSKAREERFHASPPPDEALRRLRDPRTPAQRDRDRILYASAFKRLAGVTQVVSAAESHTEVFHNRLTHSLQVAQIARRTAEKLLGDADGPEFAQKAGGLDPDAVEAAALAHDLGHPPFGHTAELELDRLISEVAGVPEGFEGNPQSFRIVTRLSTHRAEYSGLNLTRATLNAVLKYPWLRGERGKKKKKWGAFPSEGSYLNWARVGSARNARSLEAEIMDFADDVAYAIHDVEDFYRAGLVPLDRLRSDVGESAKFLESAFERWRGDGEEIAPENQSEFGVALERIVPLLPATEPYAGRHDQRAALRAFGSYLITQYLAAATLGAEEGKRKVQLIVRPEARREIKLLKHLTWEYVIRRPSLSAQQVGLRRIISDLFHTLWKAVDGGDRSIIPRSYQLILVEAEQTAGSEDERQAAKARIASDIVAGLTEGQAIKLHQRVTGIAPGSVLDPILR